MALRCVTLAPGLRPDWSPDGARILFDRIDRTRCVLDFFCDYDLYVMGADGSDITLLKDGGECGAWSPDGLKIAYVRFLGGAYVMNADGTGERLIAGGGFSGVSVGCPVVWSRDGSAIAYSEGRSDGASELTVIPSDGGARRRAGQQSWFGVP